MLEGAPGGRTEAHRKVTHEKKGEGKTEEGKEGPVFFKLQKPRGQGEEGRRYQEFSQKKQGGGAVIGKEEEAEDQGPEEEE